MRIMIYAPSGNAVGKLLVNRINSANNTPIELYDSLEYLSENLRKPISTPLVAILMPKNNAELSNLIQMRHLLRNIRIVLILPNRHAETIADGHTLRPRYVSHSDGDLSDVVAVVIKMAEKEESYLMQAV
jgi:hypothetical protein